MNLTTKKRLRTIADIHSSSNLFSKDKEITKLIKPFKTPLNMIGEAFYTQINKIEFVDNKRTYYNVDIFINNGSIIKGANGICLH